MYIYHGLFCTICGVPSVPYNEAYLYMSIQRAELSTFLQTYCTDVSANGEAVVGSFVLIGGVEAGSVGEISRCCTIHITYSIWHIQICFIVRNNQKD